MKLVSSVKLRKMNKIVEMESFYFKAMNRVLNDAIFSNPENPEAVFTSPFIDEVSGTEAVLHIVVTSNMGLCGGYNNNLLKFFSEIYKKGDKVIIIGEKGYSFLAKNPEITLETKFVHLATNYSIYGVRMLANYVINEFLSKKYKEVNLISTRYKNSISFIPSKVKVLPIAVQENPRNVYSPIYEPNKEEVINSVIPQYLSTMLYSNIYSAFLSEESSRRNTMDSADKSAQDLVDKLKLEYNKARQSAITQEITEVVNGSNAVK